MVFGYNLASPIRHHFLHMSAGTVGNPATVTPDVRLVKHRNFKKTSTGVPERVYFYFVCFHALENLPKIYSTT